MSLLIENSPLVPHPNLADDKTTKKSRSAMWSTEYENPHKRLYKAISEVGNKFAKELKLSSPAVSVEELLWQIK